jgi:glycosyltransferase involved in cell wall biosynthesis
MSTANSINDIGKTSWKKLVDIFKLYVQIGNYLTNNKVDLCYLTINAKGLAWLKELLIVAILKLYHVPVIYHYHNKGVKLNAYSFWKKKLYKFQFKDSKSILLSSLLIEDIAQFVTKKDIYICPNGIPQISNISKNKTDEQICQLLFFSNLIESKGVYILLEACKILKDKKIPFRCVYIGGEGDITGIQLDEKINHYGLQTLVEYQGKKYNHEKELAFSESDIFAFPTFYSKETFGLVNLEAMQHSLPIVSTKEGGIPDIVADGVNGFIVPNKNSKALADKLEILITNPELRNEMGQAGKRMYEEKFTLDIFEKRMVEILQDYLNKKIA